MPITPISGIDPRKVRPGQTSRFTQGPTGVYNDMPGDKPKFPTFMEHVIPADATPPSAERTVIPGEAGSQALVSDDKLISGQVSAAEDAKIIEVKRSQAAQGAINAPNMPVSGGRKAASILGGIGMGLATMNPMAGIGVGSKIYNYGREKQANMMAGNEANQATSLKNTMAIGGMYSGAAERKAQLGQANAAGVKAGADVTSANTAASHEAYDQANPPMDAFTPAGGPSKIVPKRAPNPTAAAASSVDLGSAPNVKTHGATVKVQEDGTPVVLVTDEAGKTVANVISGIKVAPEHQAAFDQYVKAYQDGHPNAKPEELRQAMLEWQKASAAQSGVNQAAADMRQQQHDSDIGSIIHDIDMEFAKKAIADPSLTKDPVKAAAEYQRIITMSGGVKEVTPYVKELLAMPKFKTPAKGNNSFFANEIFMAPTTPAKGPTP